MNKEELIEYVAQELGQYKKSVRPVIEKVFEGIEVGLLRDDVVKIVGFGHFIVKVRNPRKGRNPKTGEVVYIGTKNVPTFKPSEKLKKAVR